MDCVIKLIVHVVLYVGILYYVCLGINLYIIVIIIILMFIILSLGEICFCMDVSASFGALSTVHGQKEVFWF